MAVLCTEWMSMGAHLHSSHCLQSTAPTGQRQLPLPGVSLEHTVGVAKTDFLILLEIN